MVLERFELAEKKIPSAAPAQILSQWQREAWGAWRKIQSAVVALMVLSALSESDAQLSTPRRPASWPGAAVAATRAGVAGWLDLGLEGSRLTLVHPGGC